MRQDPSHMRGSRNPPPQPTTRSGSIYHELPELITRLEQLARRLQHFQHRYRPQLSRTDREWLYHTQQQIAFDLARLSNFGDLGGVASETMQPLESRQEVEPMQQLLKQIISLAQNTTQLLQTALLPQQQTGSQGLDATKERSPNSASGSAGTMVDAILIVLGQHNELEFHEQATDSAASSPSSGHSQPLAHHEADTTDVQMHHHLKDALMPFLPQHEAYIRHHHANRSIPVRRYHEMKLDEQIEILGRLRRRLEGSFQKSDRPSQGEP